MDRNAISSQMENIIKDLKFNGSVLVSKDNEVILAKGFGFSNFEHEVPNTAYTVFPIASISKMITAAAILSLFEQGKINLDDTLDKYFPDYPNGKDITIHHILSNTSGISNFDINANFDDIFKHTSYINYLIDLFKNIPLLFKPGSAFSYSVSGFLLLSHIIEIITKQTFGEYLKENVFNQIEMFHSGEIYYRNVIKNMAKGYLSTNDIIQNIDFVDLRIAGGGGGLYSTVYDLHKWNNALLNKTLLNSTTLKMMFTNHININESHNYGYGIFLAHSYICGKDRAYYYHTGGGPGIRTINVIYPDDNCQIIILSNVDDKTTYSKVKDEIQKIILD